jgi:hypothetical protein
MNIDREKKNETMVSFRFDNWHIHENYRVMPNVMHDVYLLMRPHINDRICDSFVRLLIEHICETFPEGNAKYNRQQHDAKY